MAAIPNTYTNLIGEQIQGGRAALGPDYLRSVLRTRALRSYMNQRRRGDVLSRLYGLDPAQARAAAFNTEAGATNNLTNSLNESELADAQGYQNYIRGLLGGQQNQEFQIGQMERQRRANRGTLGGFLGNAVGGLIPGIGSALGGRLFGRRQQNPYDFSSGRNGPVYDPNLDIYQP